MSTYYADYRRELMRAGIQPGELAIYTGAVRDGLYGGPSTARSSNAYAYWRQEGDASFQELDVRFRDGVLRAAAGEDRYVFTRNEPGNFIRQAAGPAKPVVIVNIGAEAVRVDTPLGKFQIPAGAAVRLDRDSPFLREKKKVLLTFSNKNGCGNCLKSALILEGERWKPLNICAGDGPLRIKDGPFTVQRLGLDGCGRFSAGAALKDPPSDSDYEIYIRSMTERFRLSFAGVGMGEEGVARVHHTLTLTEHVIYDFQQLRQTPAVELMRQCTAQLPGLEEVDGRLEAAALRTEGRKGEEPLENVLEQED